MTKKDFIALANYLRRETFTADFCANRNPNFKRERWLGYILGANGPNGGSVND